MATGAMSSQIRRIGTPSPAGVAGRDSVTLDDFVGATTVTVADGARTHRLMGAGLRDDDAVHSTTGNSNPPARTTTSGR